MSLDLMDVSDIHYIVDVMEQYEGEWGINELEDSQMAVSPRPVCFFPPPARISCFHRSVGPAPQLAYESYAEFENRVVSAQIALQTAIDTALSKVDPENLETSFCFLIIDAMCTNFRKRALQAVRQLTRGYVDKWADSLADDIDNAVRFLTRVYVHTIAGYSDLPLELNFLQLRSMLTSECWEILTRSHPYGTVALQFPMLTYEGAVGELLHVNFHAFANNGIVLHYIPVASWPDFCVAFCMAAHPALSACPHAPAMNSDVLRYILSLVIDARPVHTAQRDIATQT